MPIGMLFLYLSDVDLFWIYKSYKGFVRRIIGLNERGDINGGYKISKKPNNCCEVVLIDKLTAILWFESAKLNLKMLSY